jgi:hypothetical protein
MKKAGKYCPLFAAYLNFLLRAASDFFFRRTEGFS